MTKNRLFFGDNLPILQDREQFKARPAKQASIDELFED